MATPVSAEKWRMARMVALLYYIPDRRRKGSPPLPSENQEEREEGSHIYTDELNLVAHPMGFTTCFFSKSQRERHNSSQKRLRQRNKLLRRSNIV
jgi:hypothetical protein